MSSTITGNATGIVSPNTSAPNLVTAPQATVASDGESPDATVIVADVQVALNYITMLQQRVLHLYFGNGSDGAATFDGVSTYSFATKSGTTYYLNRDIYCTTISISSSVTVNTQGYAIYAASSFILSGVVDGSGGAASANSGGAMIGPHGCPGANGASTNANTTAIPNELAGLGGAGMSGGFGSLSVAGAGTNILNQSLTYQVPPFRFGQLVQNNAVPQLTLDYLRGGGAGGAGGGDGTNYGGGGGAGAALVVILSPVISLSSGSALLSNGGHGGTPTLGNCGGGGGGSGGAFLFVCNTYTNSGATFTAVGGNKGVHVGGSGATDGYDGNPGNTTPYVVTLS